MTVLVAHAIHGHTFHSPCLACPPPQVYVRYDPTLTGPRRSHTFPALRGRPKYKTSWPFSQLGISLSQSIPLFGGALPLFLHLRMPHFLHTYLVFGPQTTAVHGERLRATYTSLSFIEHSS